MRKGLFILVGLVTISVLLLALKLITVVYIPLPKVEQKVYKKTDLAQLIDDLIWEENGNRTKIYWTDSMEKLVGLGELVVTDLIKAIENAQERAAAIIDSDGQRSEWRITYDKEMLQARAAMVLGKIGDVRAVPVLMKLQCTDSRLICDYVDEAIKSIQEKGKEPRVGR